MDNALPFQPTRLELRALGKRLDSREPGAVDEAVKFLLGESRGLWHNRARAMFARRLKHFTLASDQADALVACICARLERGNFTEQFLDQVRLALQLDHARVFHAAQNSLSSPSDHVRRYAEWMVRFHPGHDAA